MSDNPFPLSTSFQHIHQNVFSKSVITMIPVKVPMRLFLLPLNLENGMLIRSFWRLQSLLGGFRRRFEGQAQSCAPYIPTSDFGKKHQRLIPNIMQVFFFTALFLSSKSAFSLEPTRCYNEKFTEILSIADFPADAPKELKELLQGISDRNGSFNSGDIGLGQKRRFSIAALSKECILVAIEHGGRGYGISLWYFSLDRSEWHRSEKLTYYGNEPPRTLQEFLIGVQSTFGYMYQNGVVFQKNETESRRWLSRPPK